MSLDKGEMPKINVSGLKFAIVASRFNKTLVDALVNDAQATMVSNGVAKADISITRVPGAAELPYACEMIAKKGEVDAVVALGVVIAGETPHHEIIANSTAYALQTSASRTTVPMINGIVVTNNTQQAIARTTGDIKRGIEFAEAAMEMASLAKNLKK